MKKINNIIIYVVTFLSLLIAVKDLNIGKYDRLLGDLTIFLVFVLPRIVCKIFKFKSDYKIEFIYIIFIFISQFLGSVLNLFNTVWWYDLFTHFISGILTSVLALMILNYFKCDKNKVFNLLFMISFTVFVAALWEFMEFFADTFLGMNVQHSIGTGVSDTMEDMLIATLGGLIVLIKYLFDKNDMLTKYVKGRK